MNHPDTANVDECIKAAAKLLQHKSSSVESRRADTESARLWLDLARFQHQRRLDLARKDTDDA